jgi:hypothetical protein
MVTQIKAAHYMVFSISAFALFILMSYYASTNTVTTQLHSHISKALHSGHRSLAEANSTKLESNGANLGGVAVVIRVIFKI